MSTIANLKINIHTNTTGMMTGLRKARTAVKKFRKSLNKTFGGLAKIGFVAAAAGAATLTLAVKKMIAVFSDFEFKMQEVRSILLDIGDNTFARLEAQARQLGSTTVFTASEAAEAMSFLARAGFNVNEVMAATPALLDLAAAANMNLAEAADITSQVVRGMGLEAQEAGRVVDVLAFASARTNTTVQQLGHAFGYVAPVASALGITLEETAAMLGVLSNAGMQADRAGTGLKNIFAEIAGEIDRNGIAALKKFTEGGIGVEKAFDIFQKRGGPAILALAKMSDITDKLVDELQDVEGVARKMADIRMDSVHGAFKLLASVVQELNIMIGERLRGSIRNIQEVLRRFVVGFTSAFKVVIDRIDLSKFSVKSLLEWLYKILKWGEEAWDYLKRFGSAIMAVINTIKGVLSLAIMHILGLMNLVWQPALLILKALGTISEETYILLSRSMTNAVVGAARTMKAAAIAAKDNIASVFKETSEKATDFIDDLIRDIKKVGSTPIFITIDPRVKTVPIQEDLAKVEKQVENQIKAAERIESNLFSGTDKGEARKQAEARLASLNQETRAYEKAAKEKVEMRVRYENTLKKHNKLEESTPLINIGGSQDYMAGFDAGKKPRKKKLIYGTPMVGPGGAGAVAKGTPLLTSAAKQLMGRKRVVNQALNKGGDSIIKDMAKNLEPAILNMAKVGSKRIVGAMSTGEAVAQPIEENIDKFKDSITSKLMNSAVEVQNAKWQLEKAAEDFSKYDEGGMEQKLYEAKELQVYLDGMGQLENIKNTKVIGPQDEAVSELYDVEQELLRVEQSLEKLDKKAAFPNANFQEITHQMGELLAEQENLEQKQKDLNNTIKEMAELNPFEKMEQRSKELTDSLQTMSQTPLAPQLDLGGVQPQLSFFDSLMSKGNLMGDMEAEVASLNQEMDQYFAVLVGAEMQHQRLVKVRGEWFDTEKIATATGDLEEIIADNELLAQTIGMTSREQEIFIAKTQGVSQAILDEAKALDKLLTQKEKDVATTKRLKDESDKLKENLKWGWGPRGEFDKRMADLKNMRDRGMLDGTEFALGAERAKEILGEKLQVDTSHAVTGIQTALGTFKVRGSQDQQLKTAQQSLQIQKQSKNHLHSIAQSLAGKRGAFTQ